MEPCYTHDPWRTWWPGYVWATAIDTQPMTSYQTSWRGFHEAPHYSADVWAESSFYNPYIKRPSPRKYKIMGKSNPNLCPSAMILFCVQALCSVPQT